LYTLGYSLHTGQVCFAGYQVVALTLMVNKNIIPNSVLDSKKLFDLAAEFYGDKVLVDYFGTIFFV